MTSPPSGRRASADKHDVRRDELAEAALRTLGEVGYARTSLREVAGNSEFSHGVVHYYFADKLELVIHAVRHGKAQCVTRYDDVVADSATTAELLDSFAATLVATLRDPARPCATLRDEVPMHRLRYDLRTQGMFEEPLREAVLIIDATLQQMIWRVVARYAEPAGRPSWRAPRRTRCSTGCSRPHCWPTSRAPRAPSTTSSARCTP